MLVGIAAIVMAIVLLVVKVIVMALLAVLFVLSPLAIALWPIEEFSWALRSLVQAMLGLLVFPILWAVCFGTFAVLSVDALFPGDSGDWINDAARAARQPRGADHRVPAAVRRAAAGDERRARTERWPRAAERPLRALAGRRRCSPGPLMTGRDQQAPSAPTGAARAGRATRPTSTSRTRTRLERLDARPVGGGVRLGGVAIVFGLYLSPLPPGVTIGLSLFVAGLPLALSYAVSGFDMAISQTIAAVYRWARGAKHYLPGGGEPPSGYVVAGAPDDERHVARAPEELAAARRELEGAWDL